MIERPLMTTDELKSMPKGHFILMKTGMHPMKTVLRLFIKWKIKLDKEYQVNQRVQREVKYADINKITSILKYKFEKDDNIKFDLKILVEEELIIKIPRKRENNGNTSNMYFFN